MHNIHDTLPVSKDNRILPFSISITAPDIVAASIYIRELFKESKQLFFASHISPAFNYELKFDFAWCFNDLKLFNDVLVVIW